MSGAEALVLGLWVLGVYRKVKETGVLSPTSDVRHVVMGADSGAATVIWNQIFIWCLSTWIKRHFKTELGNSWLTEPM